MWTQNHSLVVKSIAGKRWTGDKNLSSLHAADADLNFFVSLILLMTRATIFPGVQGLRYFINKKGHEEMTDHIFHGFLYFEIKN